MLEHEQRHGYKSKRMRRKATRNRIKKKNLEEPTAMKRVFILNHFGSIATFHFEFYSQLLLLTHFIHNAQCSSAFFGHYTFCQSNVLLSEMWTIRLSFWMQKYIDRHKIPRINEYISSQWTKCTAVSQRITDIWADNLIRLK